MTFRMECAAELKNWMVSNQDLPLSECPLHPSRRAAQVVKCRFFGNSDSENVPKRVPVLEKPLLNLGVLRESEDSINRQHPPLRLGNLLMPYLLYVKNIPWITTAFHGRCEPVPRRLITVWRTFSVWKLIFGSRIRSSLQLCKSPSHMRVFVGMKSDSE